MANLLRLASLLFFHARCAQTILGHDSVLRKRFYGPGFDRLMSFYLKTLLIVSFSVTLMCTYWFLVRSPSSWIFPWPVFVRLSLTYLPLGVLVAVAIECLKRKVYMDSQRLFLTVALITFLVVCNWEYLLSLQLLFVFHASFFRFLLQALKNFQRLLLNMHHTFFTSPLSLFDVAIMFSYYRLSFPVLAWLVSFTLVANSFRPFHDYLFVPMQRCVH